MHASSGSEANAVSPIWRHARRDPSAFALRIDDVARSYGQVTADAARVAHTLASRIEPGHRVLFVAPNATSFLSNYLGILAMGAVAVPLNPQSRAPEVRHAMEDADCSIVIAAGKSEAAVAARRSGLPLLNATMEPAQGSYPLSEAVSEAAADDPAVLLYTSGTTGRPKGAILTHGNLVAACQMYTSVLDITCEDRFGTSLPLFHVFGQVGVLLTALRAGASVSMLQPFSASGLLRMAVDHELTILSGVPTMWNAMLHARTDVTREQLTSLRLASSGGDSLPVEVAHKFQHRFGVTILNGYGLSETTSAATINRPGVPLREGSVGPALPGLEITIVSEDLKPLPPGREGEVAVRGPNVMRGYWRRPEATAEALRDGWLLTGDMGRMDHDGFLWILDRKKEVVIRGGYNVYPREIEDVLHAFPGIIDVAVVGIPDRHLGEEIAAVIVGAPDLDLLAVDAWATEHMAPYKRPRLYDVVGELPTGPTGKLHKRNIDRTAVAERALRVPRT